MNFVWNCEGACPPQSAGVSICKNWRVLGTLPAAAAGVIDLTALFVAVFGAPIAGQKLFLKVQELAGANVGLGQQFEGVVPGVSP